MPITTFKPVQRSLYIAAFAAAAFAAPALPAFAQLAPDASVTLPGGARAPLTFADIVDRVKPSVVSISVTTGTGESKVADARKGKGRGDKNDKNDKAEKGIPGMPELPDDHPLHDFFKNLPHGGNAEPQQERPALAQGSGFVISPDGYVVTNNHVIENAAKISVSFDEHQKYDAELIGTDPRTDVALIKIKSDKKFPFVKFASNTGRVGDWVVAVGNPFGLGGTVTAGIISAFGRDIGSGPYDFLQIDAAVNKGNSGGPTFNLDGDVIGVNTAIFSPSGGSVGIAFAIPAKTVTAVVEQLKKSGSVSRGWLGVKIQNVDEDTAASLGLPEAHGALVTEITPNGPSANSELKSQDAILQVGADKINDSRDLARRIAEIAPNTTIDVKVWRNNAEKLIKVKLGTFPSNIKEASAKSDDDEPTAKPSSKKVELIPLGITVIPAKGSSAEGVVIIEVAPDSDAALKGLKAGDIIMSANGETISSPSDMMKSLESAVSQKKAAVMLQVQSPEGKRFVPVRLKG